MIRVRNFFPGSLSHSSISSKVGLPTFPAEIQAVSASESSAAILSPASDRSSAAATVINAPRSRWGFSHCHSASSMLSASSSLVFICLTASSKTALLPLLLFTQILPQHSPRMHIIVAMAAEVLPVGAVRRIVVVVPVTVMDSQEMSIRLIELPGASGADESVHAKGFLAVVGVVFDPLSHGSGLCLCLGIGRQLHSHWSSGLHLSPLMIGILSFPEASSALIRLVTSS